MFTKIAMEVTMKLEKVINVGDKVSIKAPESWADGEWGIVKAIDDDVYNVYFILYGRETLKVKGLGTIKTIKFAAKLLEGEVFKGEEDMLIWVTDDENRLPVFFEAPLIVGVATGRLTGCSGLKHPFTSMIEDKRK